MEVDTPVTCLPKRERNKLTKSAHRILDYVENQTNHWLLQLVDVVPTVDTLADAKHNIGHIQTTFDNIKCNVQESWLALLLTIYRPLSTGHCAQYQWFYYNAIVIDCNWL